VPFLFQVRFDEKEMIELPPFDPTGPPLDGDDFDSENTGFCLQYTQRPA